MKTIAVFVLIFVALSVASLPNGLGSKPIDAVGVSGAHVVKGFAWDDVNRNGVYEHGEPMVQGMYASLYYDSSDLWADVPSTLIGTEKTGEDGMFMFSCLNSGRYAVQVWGLPEGYEYTTPGQGYELADSDAILVDSKTGLAQTQSFSLSGEARMTQEIGIGITEIVLVGALQGFVWNDANYNGIQETTEVGIEGVIVQLKQGGMVVAEMPSDMDGLFWFEQLTPGLYQLQFDLDPLGPGYAFTEPFKGTVSSRDSDVYQESGSTFEFQVIRGVLITDIDAGVIPSPGTLRGYYWIDQNKDGLQSADEAPLSGLQLEIYTSLGDLVQTLETDSNGKFELEIDSISYFVQAIYDSNSMVPTFQFAGDEALDSEIDDNGRSPLLTVRPGQVTSINGGFVPLLSIVHFTVWRDLNDDNELNTFLGDSFFIDHPVTLYNSNDEEVSSMNTNTLGQVVFEDLPEGSYYISVSLPGEEWGFVDAHVNGNTNNNFDSDITQVDGLMGRTDMFSLGVGELRTDMGAGIERLFSSIRGLVFQDFNRNGLRDAADTSLSGVIIYLLDNEGILTSTETDASGDFVFDRLDAGTYGLQIADESLDGYVQAEPNVGFNEVIDSDFLIGEPLYIDLGINEQYCCADAGLSSESVLPSTIEGFIWDDYEKRTGIQTGSDKAISGISIIMRNPQGATVSTATSNSQGLFRFNDIAPGTYELVAAISVHTLSPYKAGNNSALDSDFSGFGTTGLFEIVEGSHITNIDLGLIPRDGLVSGRVWFDSTPDGIYRLETGLAGVSVTLYPVTSGQRGSAIKTLTTTSTGSYSFTAVRPQEYQIFVDRPSTAWVFSAKHVGTDKTVDSDVNPDTGFTDTFEVKPQLTSGNIDAGLRLA